MVSTKKSISAQFFFSQKAFIVLGNQSSFDGSTLAFFSITKRFDVMLYNFDDFDQNLSIRFCEDCVNKNFKMAGNYRTDSYITTPWRVKSSESKISSYYKVSTVSHLSRKHA